MVILRQLWGSALSLLPRRYSDLASDTVSPWGSKEKGLEISLQSWRGLLDAVPAGGYPASRKL